MTIFFFFLKYYFLFMSKNQDREEIKLKSIINSDVIIVVPTEFYINPESEEKNYTIKDFFEKKELIYFSSKLSCKETFIIFDFQTNFINLNYYSFQINKDLEGEFIPKEWTIEGSNDLDGWEIIDNKSIHFDKLENLEKDEISNIFFCECSTEKNSFLTLINEIKLNFLKIDPIETTFSYNIKNFEINLNKSEKSSENKHQNPKSYRFIKFSLKKNLFKNSILSILNFDLYKDNKK